MKKNLNHDAQRSAAIYSPLVLKIYDLWVLGFSNRYAWKCPTRSVLLPFFQQNLSANHLDIGVGTGYYLSKSSFHDKQEIALLDLNRNSLESACAPIAHLHPLLIKEDVLNPTGALENKRFDSISLFYLFHCLPGNIENKASTVFELLHRHLNPGGTIYGATILGNQVDHNWLGRRLMTLYNKKGIFGNQEDTLSGLESSLAQYFSSVNVHQYGKVALFSAKQPN